ncbi:MAG: type IIA DNA topoisomerase subunit B [Bacteroidales bacterium]|nr:type IIA DNA topoisomerase subunit B [Bacteroidales bacterium]
MSTITKDYNDDAIQTLEWNEHIRQRPGMYIGNTGDGSRPDDGIYILIKEVLDNSIDEFSSGYGKEIRIDIEENTVTIRDYGRGIPLESVIDCASKLNTGGKFDSDVFQKSVGLNGVGLKAVNATSSYFYIESFREGRSKWAEFSAGNIVDSGYHENTGEKNGTFVRYTADDKVFPSYRYNTEFVEEMVKNYSYLNTGLSLKFNGKEYKSKNGLLDLVTENLGSETLYPPIHLVGHDIELVITHSDGNGEDIASFVNGQNTTEGGTHLSAFREAVAKTIKEHLKKDFEPADVRQSMVGAISIRVIEPIFGNQTKTKLNSKMVNDEVSVRNFIGDFIQEELDNYLHKHTETATILLKKIQESEKERKAISVIQKSTKEKVKKASLHNRKLRDCRVHYSDTKNPLASESTLFITEGDSASGSITKSRNATTQAVFSLRGKPLNSYQKSSKEIYGNEELILLKAALNVDEDLDNLRYNKIVIATDADVDGMHIRLLLITFFLKFYPELVRRNHLFILQTPLFRVRNKKTTLYCYNDEEKMAAIKQLGANPEITRFKGLGEISPDEFKEFIGENIRLEQVRLSADDNIPNLLEFYMGQNTIERQNFIRENLRSDLILEIV